MSTPNITFKQITNTPFIWLIKGYQLLFSATLNRTPSCIYPVTCSQYALIQFRRHHLPVALAKSLLRILSCNPLNAKRRSNQSKTSQHQVPPQG